MRNPALEGTIPQFAVYEGGKADFPITKPSKKEPPGSDWLRTLPVKSRFLCKQKHSRGCWLENYGVLDFSDKAALIYNFLPRMGDLTHLWVDTAVFSRDYELIEVLTPPIEEGTDGQHHLLVEEPREEHD